MERNDERKDMREIEEQELKCILVEIMKDFHDFCAENDIMYFAGYGTLLGTIRHKGFIPWDDDLDVVVPRKDYDRLLKLFNKRDSRYRLKSIDTDIRYPYNFAKIYDTKTKLIEHLYHDYDMGIYIDIFPIDNWPASDNFLKKVRLYQKITKIKSYKLGKNQGIKKNIALALLKPILYFVSLESVVKKIDAMVEKTGKDPRFIGNIVANVYGDREKLESYWLRDIVLMPFENIQINVPAGYHEILTKLYGDYMTPPPVKNQVTHHDNEFYMIE